MLDEILAERIMILDGAMGSMIYAHEPTEEDYRGDRFADHPSDLKNCTEVLVLSQPKMIEDIHRAYLEAGADIIETDTFNSNRALDGRVRPGGPRRRAEPRPPPRSPAAPPTTTPGETPASPGSSPAASARPRSSSRWASTSTTPATAT